MLDRRVAPVLCTLEDPEGAGAEAETGRIAPLFTCSPAAVAAQRDDPTKAAQDYLSVLGSHSTISGQSSSSPRQKIWITMNWAIPL